MIWKTRENMKIKYILLPIIAIFVIMLVDCFSPWQGDAGVIALSVTSDGRAAALSQENLARLEYTVTFTGPGGEFSREFIGSQTLKETLAPGKWDIKVKASIEKIKKEETLPGVYEEVSFLANFAIGHTIVDVIAGKTIPVTVQMKPSASVTYNVTFDGFDERLHPYMKWRIYEFDHEYSTQEPIDTLFEKTGPGSVTIYLEEGEWDLRPHLYINDYSEGEFHVNLDIINIELDEHIDIPVIFINDDPAPIYLIFKGSSENGSIGVPGYARGGESDIHFTVIPEPLYSLDELVFTPDVLSDGDFDGSYYFGYFTMPDQDVTISATFKEIAGVTSITEVNIDILDLINNGGPVYFLQIDDTFSSTDPELDEDTGSVYVYLIWNNSYSLYEFDEDETYTATVSVEAIGLYYFNYRNGGEFLVTVDDQIQSIITDGPQIFSFTITVKYEYGGLILQP